MSVNQEQYNSENPTIPGERFIHLLRQAGIDPDYRSIEEILWLSLLIPDVTTITSLDTETSSTPDVTPPAPTTQSTVNAPEGSARRPDRARKPATEESVYLNRSTDGEGIPASKVRVPSPAALPNSLELMRALRPFRRRVPSRQLHELDEEETVNLTVENGILTPAYAPAKERWLDVTIVIEEKPSMAIWQQAMREFQRVLERLSAFREVRVLRLEMTGETPHLLTPTGQPQPLNILADPYGRRLVFVVTDGVSAAWQNGQMAKALSTWGRTVPVVIVQMLSERMWHLTPLGKPEVSVSAALPGAANRNLERIRLWETEATEPELPFPLVVLHPASLGRWANSIVTGSLNTPAVILSEQPDEEVESDETTESLQDLSAAELFARFQYLASPTAFQLAVYLSAVPLQIPIMRLVQRAMLPDSRLEHLSEFLLGGLVERKDTTSTADIDIEDVEFIFRHDNQGQSVKALLQFEIRKGEMERLYQSVNEYIKERYGQAFDFFALVADEQGTLRVPSEALPFTEAAEPLLRRFGIKPRNATRFNLPAPFGEIPDLDQYLETLNEAFASGERAIYLTGKAGCGKTSLALRWAQQIKKRYTTAHYFLDLGPLNTEAAMGVVIQVFQPGTELPETATGLRELYLQILKNERALLVFDDVDHQIQLDLLMPPPQCLLIVTGRLVREVSGYRTIALDNPWIIPPLEILPGNDKNDPWKGVFGGLSEHSHRRVTATVEAHPELADDLYDWFSTTITVSSTNPSESPLQGEVQFFLHDSILPNKAVVYVSPGDLKAEYRINVYGAFTIGAVADGGATRLELDLAEQTDLPYEFRYPLKELLEYAVSEKAGFTDETLQPFARELTKITSGRSLKIPINRARALTNIGNACVKFGNDPLAITFFEYALRIVSKLDKKTLELEADLQSIATKIIEEGNKLESTILIEIITNLGTALFRTGEVKRAIEFYEQALSINRERRNRRGEGYALNNLGKAYEALGELGKAIGFYEQALEINREEGDYRNEALTCLQLAELYEKGGIISSAISFAELAFKNFEYLNDPQGERARELFARLQATSSQDSEHYDCLIAYSTKDFHFALRLQTALKDKGINCLVGKPLDDESTQFQLAYSKPYDKVLLCLSSQTLLEQFKWARFEAEKLGAKKLFPLLLGSSLSSVKNSQMLNLANFKLQDNVLSNEIGTSELIDFRDWESDESVFQKQVNVLANRLGFFTLTSFTFTTVKLDQRGKEIERQHLQANQFSEELAPDINLEMVSIPGGTFMMGSDEKAVDQAFAEAKRYNKDPQREWFTRELPQHKVTLSPFYMGKFTITQEQWRVIAADKTLKVARDLEADPAYFKDKPDSAQRPVEQVSWEDAEEFCARLAKKTGRAYRLPTEAEWEYACRAGTTTPFAFGETITPDIVNYNGGYPYAEAPKGKDRSETIPVGSLGVANAFGLFDMHGNVWEWCQDWYGEYEGKDLIDPTGVKSGSSRVLRGGSCGYNARDCRAADRSLSSPDLRVDAFGFRCVISARTL